VPVFGRKIPGAIIQLFEGAEIRELAKELAVKIPQYSLQSFVQGKMWKVKELIKVARGREDCRVPPNSEAVEQLARFVGDFERLKPADVPTLAAWNTFVNERASEGWEDRLHFDHLLSNFGFDDTVAERLRHQIYVATDSKTGETEEVTLEQFSFRWLSKAFTGYNVQGCLTDVTNLVFCMARKGQPEEVDESQVAEVITMTGEKIVAGNFADLWIPTHFVQDAETDDLLSWLVLEHVHKKLKTELQVLVQLPADEDFDCIQAFLKELQYTKGRVQVFRDYESRNQAALRDVFKWKFPALKGPKKGEM